VSQDTTAVGDRVIVTLIKGNEPLLKVVEDNTKEHIADNCKCNDHCACGPSEA
jgi:hypothetical protein